MAAGGRVERGAVSLPLGILVGFLAGLVESWLRARLPIAPDLVAAPIAFLLLRPQRRSVALGTVGVLLGFSTFSADPVGVLLLGGGMAALILAPLRDVVFLESVWTQAFFGFISAVALRSARELYAWFDLVPRLPWTTASFTAPLLGALLVPILLRVGVELRRVARRLVGWIGAWRARAGRQAS